MFENNFFFFYMSELRFFSNDFLYSLLSFYV